jgi:AraC-like DNA-binding protein
MDVLSEVLGAVHMTGAVFFDVACTAPWGFAVPPVQEAAPLLAPGAGRLVNYHLVTEGQATVQLDSGEELQVAAGDVVVLPHGDAHRVSQGDPATFVDNRAALGQAFSGQPRAVRFGGGGEPTHIICGFFACDALADRLFLAGLPPVFKVHIRSRGAGAWLEASIRHLVGEAASGRPGTTVLLARMAEARFVETLRHHLDDLPSGQRGWLAGARDPVVGRALALLHGDPARPWTAAQLAAEAGASRSVLGERFVQFLGVPPLTYLMRWRLQLAAQQLETTQKTVLEVAMDVGYQSESAFNRAFKRELGLPPARYRRACRQPRADGSTP